MDQHVRRDPYAHLRDNLRTYRFAVDEAVEIPWCVSCQAHQAPAPGALCPSEPDRSVAA